MNDRESLLSQPKFLTQNGQQESNGEALPKQGYMQPIHHLRQRSKKALNVRQGLQIANKRQSARINHRVGYLSSQQFSSQNMLGGHSTVGGKAGGIQSPLEAKGFQAFPHVLSSGNLKLSTERDCARKMWTNAIETREAHTGKNSRGINRMKVKKSGQ